MNTKDKECFEYCLEWLKKNRDEPESFMERMEELAKGCPKDINVNQETYNFRHSISIEEARFRWPEK